MFEIKLTVPVGYILVSDAGGDVKHDDTALTVDVVSITETSELLLSCGVPDIELDVTQVLPWLVNVVQAAESLSPYRAESERVNLNTESRNVLLLELSSQMTLDEGGLVEC